MKAWKGSYTVEAAVIIPLFLWVLAVAMHTGIDLLSEVYEAHEEQQLAPLWEVETFYKYQIVEGVIKS